MVAGKIGHEQAPGELARRSLRSPGSLGSRSSACFARRIFFRPGWEPVHRLQVKTYFQKHYNTAILSGNCDGSPLIDSGVFEAYVERISVCYVFGSRTQTENFHSTHIIKDGALEIHVRKAAGRFLSHCFSFLISKVTIKIFCLTCSTTEDSVNIVWEHLIPIKKTLFPYLPRLNTQGILKHEILN